MPRSSTVAAARTWRALALVALVILGPAPDCQQAALAAATAAGRDVDLDLDVAAAPAPAEAPKEGSVSQSSSKRIAAVNETLTDILLSIESEEREEAQNYLRFMTWCESEATALTEMLAEVRGERQRTEVAKQELEATNAKLNHEIEMVGLQMSTTRDEMDQAANLKANDDSEATDDLNLNLQSINQVSQAIEIVSKVQNRGGFLQNGVLKRLQLNEPGESSFVLGIMKQLKKGLEKTRAELLKAQEGKDNGDQDMWSTKKELLLSLEEQMGGKQQLLTKATVDLVEVKRLLKNADEKIPRLEAQLSDTKEKCALRQKTWKVRGEDRAQERAAIREALAYLSQTEKFLDKKDGKGAQDDEDGLAPSFLQAVASVQTTAALLRGALKGGLTGINMNAAKDVVAKMTAVLVKQQKDEEDMMKYCQSELGKTGEEQEKVQDELKMIVAGMHYKSSEIATMQKEIDELNAALEKMKKQVDEATKIRKKEHQDYETGKKDRLLSMKVLKQAQQVLKRFYATVDKTGFLQQGNSTGEAPKSDTWFKSTRKEIAGNAVIQLLEKIADDILMEQRAAESDEKTAASSFEKLLVDSRAQFDNSMSEITERMKRKAKLTVEINADEQDKTQTDKDLTDVKAQLKSLHDKCDELMKTFQERTKARTFQISQLRDVTDILSGSQVAVRTGLLEQPPQQPQDDAAGRE